MDGREKIAPYTRSYHSQGDGVGRRKSREEVTILLVTESRRCPTHSYMHQVLFLSSVFLAH